MVGFWASRPRRDSFRRRGRSRWPRAASSRRGSAWGSMAGAPFPAGRTPNVTCAPFCGSVWPMLPRIVPAMTWAPGFSGRPTSWRLRPSTLPRSCRRSRSRRSEPSGRPPAGRPRPVAGARRVREQPDLDRLHRRLGPAAALGTAARRCRGGRRTLLAAGRGRRGGLGVARRSLVVGLDRGGRLLLLGRRVGGGILPRCE